MSFRISCFFPSPSAVCWWSLVWIAVSAGVFLMAFRFCRGRQSELQSQLVPSFGALRCLPAWPVPSGTFGCIWASQESYGTLCGTAVEGVFVSFDLL
ncbi:hypothetical protein GDO78_006288 [Eleutherodactylus coqui]|uniref:Uncharacterized protein n=1 Tax=Eleutherodactylus coqui TaxID=57060 RepID=A0A8J6FMW1_ELECQ|nr:hypothetical protein GDO78_006288 [Eleutherodactylus coqui]